MTNADHAGAVVVGVDGSRHSEWAVRAAIMFAVRENRRVDIVHAYDVSPTVYPAWGVGVDTDTYRARLIDAAQRVADDAVLVGREVAPEVEIGTSLIAADPREALVAAAESAHMIVVGSRGLGTVRRLLLGSVSSWVTQHAGCPALVVRPLDLPRGAPIVVGVDGTETSAEALEFAFSQASMQEVPLTVLHCYTPWVRTGSSFPGKNDLARDSRAAEQLAVAESVAGLREKYPDTEVTFQLEWGDARAYLVDASKRSRLLVVGSRHGLSDDVDFTGSVSRPVVEHAHCSVAVVPASGSPAR